MPIDDNALLSLDLDSTLFFPVSGDPIGFNHFAAAEWIMTSNPALERVVFILSNGYHPDPTKSDAAVSPAQRLAFTEMAVDAIADPGQSYFAKLASRENTKLHVSPQTLLVSTVEYSHSRPVPTIETVRTILGKRSPGQSRVNWFAGSDLIRRMGDPSIFSGEDLEMLAQCCHYRVLERPGDPLPEALDEIPTPLREALTYDAYDVSAAPDWLANYLNLSSTRIRNAVEAGDPLAGMLPEPVARQIIADGAYTTGRAVTREVDLDGKVLGTRSRLQLDLEALGVRLSESAGRIAALLDARREAGKSHTLSVAETSTGGFLTAAFGSRSGASRYFRQGRFAYDQVAKETLTGVGEIGSSVSGDMVSALAQGMRDQAQTDFALAESGMAGPPDGRRRSLKSGMTWIAVATPGKTLTEIAEFNPFLTRKEHQYEFARHAIGMLERWLAEHPE